MNEEAPTAQESTVETSEAQSSQTSSVMSSSTDSSMATSKADTGKRIVAYLIDVLIVGAASAILSFVPVIGALVSWAGSIAYILLRDGLEFDFMDGRSIGKKFMKLRPVRMDGQPMDMMSSVKRNWPFIIPILPIVEAILLFTDDSGRRIGDKVADTIIVEVDS